MDFTWGRIEATCGKYNFSAYDTLLTTMEAHGVQPYWILVSVLLPSAFSAGPLRHGSAIHAVICSFITPIGCLRRTQWCIPFLVGVLLELQYPA